MSALKGYSLHGMQVRYWRHKQHWYERYASLGYAYDCPSQ